MHTFLGDIKSWSFFFSLPRSVPSVWSTGGPVFPVAFLPLTHWDWPTLLSSQWHVPVSNVQPSSPELVSLTINNITYIILNVWSNSLKNKKKKTWAMKCHYLYTALVWRWHHQWQWILHRKLLPRSAAECEVEDSVNYFLNSFFNLTFYLFWGYLKRFGYVHGLREPAPPLQTAVGVKNQFPVGSASIKLHIHSQRPRFTGNSRQRRVG